MKSAFISLADRLRQAGKKEGMQQSRKQAVLNMLREGLDIAFICKILEVSPEFVEQVRKEIAV